jgi:branched-chain amino acid transport system permease protein
LTQIQRALNIPRREVRLAIYGVLAVGAWYLLDNLTPRGLPLGIVLLGLVFGSMFAVLAVALVLVYRTNRVINFAQSEMGGIGAVVAIQLVFVFGWNYFLAIGIGLLASILVGGIVYMAVIRRFRNSSRLILAVVTIALSQVLLGLSFLVGQLFPEFDLERHAFEVPIDLSFTVFPVIFNADHLVAMGAALVVMLLFVWLFRYTRYGVAVRSAADNQERASLLGVPIVYLHLGVWAMAAMLASLVIMLRVPIVGFGSLGVITTGGNALLLRTFAAAVIGRMENIPRTVAAALVLGIFQSLASWTWGNTDVVDALLVAVILVALLVQRDFFSRALETGISAFRAIRDVRPVPAELRGLPEIRYGFGGLKVALVVGAVLLPLFLSSAQAQAVGLLYIYSIIAISLVVLTGWAGHISLGQFAFVGFGAATTAVLYGRHGADFFAAAAAGVIVAALVALVVGLPALRIRGPFLAVTTLAFAVTTSSFFLSSTYFPWFIQDSIRRPDLWGRIPLSEEWQMYYLTLASLLLVVLLVRNLRNGRIGRGLIAVRDNEMAAETVTFDLTRWKLQAFVLSGALCGFAGALYAIHQRGVFTGSFDSAVSVRLFLMVVIGGLGSIGGAIMGATYIRGAEFFLPSPWDTLIPGIGVLFLLMFMPEGLGGALYDIRDRILRWVSRRRGILVPSLVADKRVEDKEEGVPLEEVLARLGPPNGEASRPRGRAKAGAASSRGGKK